MFVRKLQLSAPPTFLTANAGDCSHLIMHVTSGKCGV